MGGQQAHPGSDQTPIKVSGRMPNDFNGSWIRSSVHILEPSSTGVPSEMPQGKRDEVEETRMVDKPLQNEITLRARSYWSFRDVQEAME